MSISAISNSTASIPIPSTTTTATDDSASSTSDSATGAASGGAAAGGTGGGGGAASSATTTTTTMNPDGTETITTKDAQGKTISVVTVGTPTTGQGKPDASAAPGSLLNLKA